MHKLTTSLNPTRTVAEVPWKELVEGDEYVYFRDPSYQRNPCWIGSATQSYYKSVARDQASDAITLCDVKSSYKACAAAMHEDTQHYKDLMDAGVTHKIIDGSNRLLELERLYASEAALEGPCEIWTFQPHERYNIGPGESRTLAQLENIDHGKWARWLTEKKLVVITLKGCCRADERIRFIDINSNTTLKSQEKRNADHGILSDHAREWGSQPMPLSVDMSASKGVFYDRLCKTLGTTKMKRRGSDEVCAKFFLLARAHGRGAFTKGSSEQLELFGKNLDNAYKQQNMYTQRECDKAFRLLKDTLTLMPYIYSKVEKEKFLINTAMFVLGMEDHGLKLNHKAAESDFKELGIFLFDEEDKRKAEFVIPQHVRDQYDDQKWEEVKREISNKYCYTSWMSLDSNSSMNKCSWASIEPRYVKATTWSVKRLLKEKPDLCKRVFSAVPNTKPRPRLTEGEKDQLLKLQSGRCYLSGVPINKYDIVNRKHADRPVDVDHMRPRVLGGGDEMENLRLVHRDAHTMKGVLVVHDPVNIPFVDHDKEYEKMLGLLTSEDRCLHKVYENHDEGFINYLVIDLDDIDKFAAIRDKFKNELQPSERGEGVPSRSVPPMTSTPSPSMQANV
jgi:hypothetical protein